MLAKFHILLKFIQIKELKLKNETNAALHLKWKFNTFTVVIFFKCFGLVSYRTDNIVMYF